MTHRIRALLVSLVVVAAAGLLPVASAPAAHAEPSTSCMNPSLTGKIVKTNTGLLGLVPKFEYRDLVASAPDACASSTFALFSYRYEVSFYYWWKDRVTVASSNVGNYRGGSVITFPDTTSPRQTLDPTVGVRIDAYRTHKLLGITIRETQRYLVDAPGTTTAFNTATMEQAYDCAVSTQFPEPVGSRAMCP